MNSRGLFQPQPFCDSMILLQANFILLEINKTSGSLDDKLSVKCQHSLFWHKWRSSPPVTTVSLHAFVNWAGKFDVNSHTQF